MTIVWNPDTDSAAFGLSHFQDATDVQFVGIGQAFAYRSIASKLITEHIMIRKGYFADVNQTSLFWMTRVNIKSFCNFIISCSNISCKLPFHLAPGLLEIFTQIKLCTGDLRFFLKKMDPDVEINVRRSGYNIRSTGYDSIESAYHTLCLAITPMKKRIYDSIRLVMQEKLHRAKGLRGHSRKLSINRSLDNQLSESYQLSAAMVLSAIDFRNQSYAEMFSRFVESLTEAELKAMLLTFGRTTSLNVRYKIRVERMTRDIDIQTCFRKVWLNVKLFKDADTLQNLKIHFVQADNQMNDGGLLEHQISDFCKCCGKIVSCVGAGCILAMVFSYV